MSLSNQTERGYGIASNIPFAGRVFYAIGTSVMYSQILTTRLNMVKCYVQNDPTDPDIAQTLDTDGGRITIGESSQIKELIAFRSGVLALSSNGVWLISSSGSFTPTTITVTKISNTGIYHPRSAVFAKDACYYMAKGAIIKVSLNQLGDSTYENITDLTIKSYLEDNFMDKVTDRDVSVAFSEESNEIHWMNRDGEVLILNLRTGGFYPQRLTEYTEGPFDSDGFRFGSIIKSTTEESDFEYGTFWRQPNGTWSFSTVEMSGDNFIDYEAPDITNEYPAYMEAGPEHLGKFSHNKSITSYSVAFERTEEFITGFDVDNNYIYDKPSSCMFRVVWDVSSYAGYSSKPRQCYKLNSRRWIPDSGSLPFSIKDQGDDLVLFSDKVRGNGQLSSLRFEAEGGKDMVLIGMSVEYSMKGRQR